MKIRCKNCYRVLNPNEEYCTSCGEHSSAMQRAMITGDYGPDVNAKLKIGIGIFLIAGFIMCGLLQVIFAVMQNKELGTYNDLFCEVNSIFYSSILVFIISLVCYRKELKKVRITKPFSNYLIAMLIGLLSIIVILLISKLISFGSIFPKYICEYLQTGIADFFSFKNECILKILVGFLLLGISMEIIIKKTLIDALDDTMLGEKTIFMITVLITTFLETAWIMSIDVIISVLIINIVTTGIYMYTERNIYLNIILRIILVVASVVTFLI